MYIHPKQQQAATIEKHKQKINDKINKIIKKDKQNK